MNNPVIILKEGKKVVVFPTMEKPTKGLRVEVDAYNAHLHSLESYPLPDNLSHLPLGEAKGLRKQWQVYKGHWTNDEWVNVTPTEYELAEEDYRRILITQDEGEKDKQKRLLTEIMQRDQELGLYTPPTSIEGEKELNDVDWNLKRLYDWVIDEKRKPAITAFTSGWLRNVAREIEYRLEKPFPKPLNHKP